MKGKLVILTLMVAFAAGCRSAKPPAPVPVHVTQAQRAAAQAAKMSEEGQWAAAARQWSEAADLYFLLNDRTNAAVALHNLGQAYRGAGGLKAAESSLNEAAKINQELNRGQEWFRNYIALAQVAAAGGQSNAVAERLEVLSRRVGEMDSELKALFHNELGLLRLEQGRFSEAADAFQRAGKYFEEARDKYGSATVLANQGKLYEQQGNYPAAMDAWQAALGQFETQAHPLGITRSLLGLGRTLLEAQQDLPKAEDYLRRAARNFETLNRPRDLEETQVLLAKCLKAQGKTRE